jgi:hypothetical protein
MEATVVRPSWTLQEPVGRIHGALIHDFKKPLREALMNLSHMTVLEAVESHGCLWLGEFEGQLENAAWFGGSLV